MAFLNPWSVNNKYTAIHDFVDDNELDLLAVAESWVKTKENNKPQCFYQHEMFPQNHEMILFLAPGNEGVSQSSSRKVSRRIPLIFPKMN